MKAFKIVNELRNQGYALVATDGSEADIRGLEDRPAWVEWFENPDRFTMPDGTSVAVVAEVCIGDIYYIRVALGM